MVDLDLMWFNWMEWKMLINLKAQIKMAKMVDEIFQWTSQGSKWPKTELNVPS